MKKTMYLIFLIFHLFNTKAQTSLNENDTLPLIRDTIRRNEIAYSFFSVNSNINLPFEVKGPTTEILNGVFFRHKFKSFSLRTYLSYYKNETNVEYDKAHNSDYGTINTTDLTALFGIQKPILKKKKLFMHFLTSAI